jgi:MFS family permease
MSERRPSSSLWRNRNFLKLWTAQTISQFGTQVTLLALPLAAVLVLDATPFQVGLLTTLEYLPFLLVGLPAGVWVDRLPRRPILIAGDVLRALTLGSVPIAYQLDALSVTQLYVVAFLTGIGTVFFDIADQAFLPSLVGRDRLVQANGRLEMTRSGAQLAGPGIAGFLIEWVRAPMAIALDAMSYVLSSFFLAAIPRTKRPTPTAGAGRRSMRADIGEGLRYVFRHPLLLPIAGCTATSNLFSSMLLAVLILFAVRELGLSPGEIGIIFAIGNVGFLVGAVAAARVAKVLRLGRAIVVCAMVSGASNLLIPLASPSTAAPLLVGAMFLMGLGGTVYNVNQVSLRQAITPEKILGRMNATMRFLVWGTMPIGAFVGGILGNTIGLRPTVWVEIGRAHV